MIYLILAVYFYGVVITYIGLNVSNALERLPSIARVYVSTFWFIIMPIGLVALVANHDELGL
jgi:hypothetical protein